MDKIRVGIVNYLNTKPLLYGLQLPPINRKIELIGAYPALLSSMLRNDEIDIGLIPVASIPQLPSWHIVGNHCIAAEGEIASVCLFSEVPMNEIETVYLDYQSRSSVGLLKWLIREYWGINPKLIQATDDKYRSEIKGHYRRPCYRRTGRWNSGKYLPISMTLVLNGEPLRGCHLYLRSG